MSKIWEPSTTTLRGPGASRAIAAMRSVMVCEVWVWGLGVWVWGLGFGVWGLGFGVKVGHGLWGLGLGFGVWGGLLYNYYYYYDYYYNHYYNYYDYDCRCHYC